MKNINELDPRKYKYYIYTDLSGDFKIQVPTLGGWVDLMDGYDIFSINNGSIIAFDSVSLYGFFDAQIIQGDQKRHFELTTFEELEDVFQEKETHGFTFYIFTKSAEMPAASVFGANATINGKPINQSTFARCDIGKYGAIPFELGAKPYNIKYVFNVMNYSGFGHIVRIETLEEANKNTSHHSLYMATRTLEGAIKTIYEWSVVAQEPFNNKEPQATAALNFINNPYLEDSVVNTAISRQPDMGLAQYIKSGETVVDILHENRVMSDDLKNFIMSKCRYKSLNLMFKNHPANPEIPEMILNQEKEEAEEVLLKYSVINGVDFENKSLQDIKEIIQSEKGSIRTEYSISPLDAVERLL